MVIVEQAQQSQQPQQLPVTIDDISRFNIYGLIGFTWNPLTQLVFPDASNLDNILPSNLVSQIFQDTGKAWLKASFPPDTSQCELELFIRAEDTPYIVQELFNIQIKCEDKQRGLLFNNGLLQRIKGSNELSGLPIEKVRTFLGMEAAGAYESSPSRLKEISKGQNKITKCLVFEIWSEEDCPSRFTLPMEVQKLSHMTSQLKF